MQEHATLIDQLGGGTVIAEALFGGIGERGRHRDTIYKWKRNGIPWRWRSAIVEIARERGVDLPDNFLRPGQDDAANLSAPLPAGS